MATVTSSPPRLADAAPPSTQRRTRRNARTGGAPVLNYLLLAVLFVVLLFPVYYGIIGSFMSPSDINTFPAKLWPTSGFVAGPRSRTRA